MLPLARTDHLLVHEVGDELVVYDMLRYRAHALNRAAALVWRSCDGRTDMRQMVRLLHTELNLPRENEEMARFALALLDSAHLLQVDVAQPQNHEKAISRRKVVKDFALGGGLTALWPLVTSLAVPTPAQAASLPPDNRNEVEKFLDCIRCVQKFYDFGSIEYFQQWDLCVVGLGYQTPSC